MAVLGAIIGRMTVHLTISLATVLAGLVYLPAAGAVFSTVFSFLDAADSTPFFAQVQTASASDLLYFSFITMTTVGYGDLTPVGNLPRMLAATEALHRPDLPGDGGGVAGRQPGAGTPPASTQMTSGHRPCGRCDLRRH